MNLKDVFDKEIFTLDKTDYSDNDFQSMSIDDLETLKLRIQKKIELISEEVREKQKEIYDFHTKNGSHSYINKYLKDRKRERSIKERILTYINFLIKKQLREKRNINDFFVDQAKIVLPKTEFENILVNARKEMSREGEI